MLFPSFASHTRKAPQDIVRIYFSLDGQEPLIILAPESVLKVVLKGISLTLLTYTWHSIWQLTSLM